MRLGLFGGTFNPIHLGHLRAAVEVREAFHLEKILLIPSAVPPHKPGKEIAEADDRLDMVRLAVRDEPGLEASDVELIRPGPSYTVETLQHMKSAFGPDCTMHFIVGIDAFAEVTTWKSYKELFRLAHFIVLERPGARIGDLKGFIIDRISEAYQENRTEKRFDHPQWLSIFRLHVTHLDIAATRIREKIREGRSVRFLVPSQVEAFIRRKGLYR